MAEQRWLGLPGADPAQVYVKSRDSIWNAEGREYTLAAGMRGRITKICWEEWTTHVQVDFPDLGRIYIGWDMLIRDEPSNEVKDHE